MGSPRLRAAVLMGSFVVLGLPGSVLAHAELQRAIPADGKTLTDPVTVVTASYSQDLAVNSKLLVKDASGATVATGTVDPGNARRMIARPTPPLGDGAYEVQSTSISADDGDIERVRWTFTVALGASASPTALPSPSAEPTPICTDLCSGQPSGGEPSSASPVSASPAPSTSPAPGDGASDSSNVLLPIIAAFAIVAIGAGYLLNRNRGRS